MGLAYCTSCQTVEGDWITKEVDGEDVKICGECGEEASYQSVPEHDDCDVER